MRCDAMDELLSFGTVPYSAGPELVLIHQGYIKLHMEVVHSISASTLLRSKPPP